MVVVKYIVGAIILIAYSGVEFTAGVVWSGPWPTKKALAEGRAKPEKRWQGTSLRFGSLALVWAGFMWTLPVMDNVWLRYAVFIVIPFAAGVVVRRVMLRNERRGEQAT